MISVRTWTELATFQENLKKGIYAGVPDGVLLLLVV
jgi:hypothetical protein